MPREKPNQVSVSELLDQLARKKYAFNFDVTMELSTPEVRVGQVRLHGRIESAPSRK